LKHLYRLLFRAIRTSKPIWILSRNRDRPQRRAGLSYVYFVTVKRVSGGRQNGRFPREMLGDIY